METKVTPAWTKGLILSLVCIIYGLILYFTGQAQNKSLGWVQFIILIGAIIWSCIQFANQMDGNVTFGNVFAHGFKVTAAVAAILSIYTFFAFKFIYPEMIDLSLDEARKNMEAKGNMSSDQVDQSVAMVRKFFIPFAIGGILIGTALIGAIAALIGAGVAKKNPNPFVQQ
jgi:NADH:ubiquinone oxidoreductase subunit 6 (subunit J)